MKPGHLRRSPGYTLVELSIALAAIGLLTIVSSRLIVLSWRACRADQSWVEVQRDGRTALNFIESTLRTARPGSVVLGRESVSEPPYSRIEFTDTAGQAVRIYQSGGSLYVNKGASAHRLSRDIDTLFFLYPDSSQEDLLGVSLCLAKSSYQGNKRSYFHTVQRIRLISR